MKRKKLLLLLPVSLIILLFYFLQKGYAEKVKKHTGGFSRNWQWQPKEIADAAVETGDTLSQFINNDAGLLLVKSKNGVVRFEVNNNRLVQTAFYHFPNLDLRVCKINWRNNRFVVAHLPNQKLHWYVPGASIPEKTVDIGVPVSQLAFVSDKKIITRYLDDKKYSQLVVMLNDAGKRINTPDSTALPSVNDAGLAYDGAFVSNSGYTCAVSFFCNRMVVFDSTGKISWLGKTIDSVYHPPVVYANPGKTSFRYLGVKQPVNPGVAIYNGKIYVYSVVASNNPAPGKIGYRWALDRYNLYTGIYEHSLFPEKNKNEPVKDFYISTSGSLYALTQKRLISYQKIP
jgi:hypothetical protein